MCMHGGEREGWEGKRDGEEEGKREGREGREGEGERGRGKRGEMGYVHGLTPEFRHKTLQLAVQLQGGLKKKLWAILLKMSQLIAHNVQRNTAQCHGNTGI